MDKVYLEVVKICAVGCDKNFITIRLGHRLVTFMTLNRGLYDDLKRLGVPTSQSLRKDK